MIETTTTPLSYEQQAGRIDRPGQHLLRPEHLGVGGMRELYHKLHVIPTSTHADEILIRSHVAYWAGVSYAERAEIKPSRGHSYRLHVQGGKFVVRITDHYDHRDGVEGWN